MTAAINDDLTELKSRLAEVIDLGQAAAILGWDQETMMPPKGVQFRVTQQETLNGIIHERFTSPRIGDLLQKLEEPSVLASLSEVDRAIVRVARHDYDRATKLPRSLVKELAAATTRGVEEWRQARRESRWDLFAPALRRIVALKRQEAACLGYTDHPYDALLDEYEPGMTTARLQSLFTHLQQETLALLDRIDQAPRQIDRAIIQQPFDIQAQRAFGEAILRQMGFDFEAGREDTSTHPFTTSFGPTDVRVTTRFDPNDLAVALYATIHEGGHALYDQGIPVELARTIVGQAASLGIHESQSRLWENFIGRSLPFWRYALPVARTYFPDQFAHASPEEIVAAVNRVARSLIRVEADEVTYNLHIILRFEIERQLIRGELEVDDLPARWNQLMDQLLGIVPPNDASGVLQDTHWGSGLFGYFPTYTLGNLYAAQIWDAIRRNEPGLDERLAAGDFHVVLAWLREHIHRWGRIYEPEILIQRATGEPLNPTHLTRYLTEKYSALYGLS